MPVLYGCVPGVPGVPGVSRVSGCPGQVQRLSTRAAAGFSFSWPGLHVQRSRDLAGAELGAIPTA